MFEHGGRFIEHAGYATRPADRSLGLPDDASTKATKHGNSTQAWIAGLDARADGFAPDNRFSREARTAVPSAVSIDPAADAEAERQLVMREAFEAGLAQGRSEGRDEVAVERAAHERLRLSLGRLDEQARRALAERLAHTVMALCEKTMAPFALDPQALQRRCTAAAALLDDGHARYELHLHPDDIITLEPAFAAEWIIVPAPQSERGAVRIEGGEAGVVDGPGQWRAALERTLAC